MRLSISRLLIIFGIALLTGFLLAISTLLYSLQQVRIDGPEYQLVIDSKDLVADILPPPMFVVEAYMTATETAGHPEETDANIARLRELRQEFETRMAVWAAKQLPDDIRQQIDTKLRPATDAFWDVLERRIVPQFLAAKNDGRDINLTPLRRAFHQQRATVVDLVALSGRYLQEVEARAASDVQVYGLMSLAACLVAIVILVFGLLVFRRLAVTPMRDIGHYMTALASGDYETEVPHMRRRDEVGDMAKAVAHLRLSAVARVRLEEEASQQAQRTADERNRHLHAETQRAATLSKVIEDLGAGLDRLSRFNIHVTLDEPFEAEFEILRNNFNRSLAVFQETMQQVLGRADGIHSNAESLEGSGGDLARRTEQQAAALEETAASLDEITSSVSASSRLARDTREKSNRARDRVSRSANVVRETVEAMSRIEDASRHISSITGVIDEIAFQTNLLALNAGVEAARAGEAGKGFAVVAQEVRELAQRSARAAKEIKALIDTSNTQVEGGVALVSRTGQALQEIEMDIDSIVRDMETIAKGSAEQTDVLRAINTSVNQLDQITQQNAAMVEEVNAATHSLTEEVGEMVGLVSQFIGSAEGRQAPARHAVRAA